VKYNSGTNDILRLTHDKVKTFFLKNESYCSFDLPIYIDFSSLLSSVDVLLDGKNISGIMMEKKKAKRGVAIFAKACFGHPSPSKQQKLNATANAFGAPDVLRTCHFATTIVNSVLAS
jgi:hypothetical protein